MTNRPARPLGVMNLADRVCRLVDGSPSDGTDVGFKKGL